MAVEGLSNVSIFWTNSEPDLLERPSPWHPGGRRQRRAGYLRVWAIFRMESSDMGDYGMNTPACFCFDDLTILVFAAN